MGLLHSLKLKIKLRFLTYKYATYFSVLTCSMVGIAAYVNMPCTHCDSVFTKTTSISKEQVLCQDGNVRRKERTRFFNKKVVDKNVILSCSKS